MRTMRVDRSVRSATARQLLGEVRTERLREFRKAERSRPRVLAPALGESTHGDIAEGQKFFEAAAEVLEGAFYARQVDAVLGVVARDS